MVLKSFRSRQRLEAFYGNIYSHLHGTCGGCHQPYLLLNHLVFITSRNMKGFPFAFSKSLPHMQILPEYMI